MDNDAIAPVIAVMLLLAIGVTFFAVYSTTYLPALKEQAEVGHLKEVETGMVKFSSDIDNAVYMKNEGKLSEQIPLGGGDILVNSLKSSGTVRIQEEQYPYLVIRNGSGDEYPMYMVNYSYSPLGNFWVDQGYTWQYGYVNITKGTRTTPLQYYTMKESEGKIENFVEAIISKPRHYGGTITFDTVSFSKGDSDISSGNGNAQISLNATRSIPVQFVNSSTFSFSINRTSPLNTTVYNYLFTEMTKEFGNGNITSNLVGQEITLSPNNPVSITINRLQIELETH